MLVLFAGIKKELELILNALIGFFNYKGLAQKYFYQKIINNSELNKYDILRQWCAIEAAIKWDRGKLSKDIKYWKYKNYKKKYISYKEKINN